MYSQIYKLLSLYNRGQFLGRLLEGQSRTSQASDDIIKQYNLLRSDIKAIVFVRDRDFTRRIPSIRNWLFSFNTFTTVEDVGNKLVILNRYIVDFIAANYPDEFIKIDWSEDASLRKENERLQQQISGLGKKVAKLEAELRQKSLEINKLKQDSKMELESLQKRLLIHNKNLQDLLERKAKYGMNPPTELLRQIEDEKEAIADIKKRIEEFEKRA